MSLCARARVHACARTQVRFTYDEDGQLQVDDFFPPYASYAVVPSLCTRTRARVHRYVCELLSAHVLFDHAWAAR